MHRREDASKALTSRERYALDGLTYVNRAAHSWMKLTEEWDATCPVEGYLRSFERSYVASVE